MGGELDHVQRAVGDVRDSLPGRVDARLRDGACGWHQGGERRRAGLVGLVGLAGLVGFAGSQDPELAVERERDRAAAVVGRVGDDAGRQLADSLAADSLGLGDLARPDVPGRGRVGQQLLAGVAGQVEEPQAADGILTAVGPQEQDAPAVGGDGHGARDPEGEAPRPGELAGKFVENHRHNLPQTSPPLRRLGAAVGAAVRATGSLSPPRRPTRLARGPGWGCRGRRWRGSGRSSG